MRTELRIVVEGDVPGLAEHRVSLRAFYMAFRRLDAALQRIASQILVGAAGPEYGDKGGRLHKAATQMEVLLVQIEGSSPTTAVLEVTPPPLPSGELISPYERLPDDTVSTFLRDVERESMGELSNSVVRKYLKALPEGLHHHSYKARYQDGTESTLDVSSLALAEDVDPAPGIVHGEGELVRAEFCPGTPKLWIKPTTGGTLLPLAASEDQVEEAIELRGGHVSFDAVVGRRQTRLIGIWASSSPRPVRSYDAQRDLFDRWADVLSELAK